MAIEFEVPYILADDSESFEYDNAQYNPDLAMQCARLSAASYGNYHYLPDEDIFYQMDSESNNLLDEELSRNDLSSIERGYLGNNSKENMQYTFAHKEVTNNNEARNLTFVIIRGTSQENWQEITDVMKSNMTKHYVFQKNSNKLRQALEQYLKKQGINNSIVVLTGHCAGGAIANLAAHDLTQNPIDGINGNDVYGYTFAAPNCTSELNSTDNNIYNFCFTDDFFSQFPLDSWGYGKYGITYVASAQEMHNTNENFKNELMSITKKTTGRDNAEFDALSTESIIDYISNIWQSIDDYYDLKSKDIEKETVNIFASSSANMSLYEYLTKYINGIMSNDAKTIQKLNLIDSYVFNPIKAYFIAGDKKYLNDTHQMYTYYSALKNNCFTSLSANKTSYETISVLATPDNYDESEISQIRQFLKTDDNAELLGWDIDDVSAWNGVEWNIDGRMKSIQLYYKNLTGSLNLSGFSGLETLICSGNKLSAVNLNGCVNMKKLLCDNNELKSLNISGLTKLSEVNCNYNYLNNISSSMEAIITKNGLACYNQQKIPEDALYNENELLILKNIISGSDLWDLERPHTWSCVKWQNSSGIYQCTGLDLRGLNLTGTLDLKGLNNLQYIYCSDNEYEMLDITGCENLNTIRMSGCNNINLTTDGYGAISLFEYNNNTDFSKNNAETLINICEYNEGIVKQFNQWTPSGDAIPDNIKALNPLGKYANLCTVTETNNNDGMLILNVSAEQPETISSLVLYIAEYDDNNVLSDLKEISGYIQDDSVMIYGIEIPQNTAYKLMLWDNDQYPVIDCITNM